MVKKFSIIKNILIFLTLMWTLLIVIISIINFYRNYDYAKLIAIESAKTSVNKDLAFRSWVASHGGVYVPINKRTPPNKHLVHIKNRDFTAKGKSYTLMNPAYTLVQMMHDYSKLYGIKTKLTSKTLLNPKNRADTWEINALTKIDVSKKQFYELAEIKNEPYLRLMNPLIIKESCLKCHAHQGYKVGDLRGGVSVSIPMKKLYFDVLKKNIFDISIFLLIWLIGIVFLYFVYKRINIVFAERQRMYEQYIYGLVDIVEQRDYYTAGHSKRVANYSKILAKAMNYSYEDQKLIYRAAMLHDIGKIAIPDSVFLKPSKLNYNEYEMIKEHVSISYNMLKNIDVFKEMANIVRNHHEMFDGNGYPRGLKGDESPMLSQILSLCDAFDAMTTNRVYKKKKDIPLALKELSKFSGKQFNPKIVKVALKAFADIEIKEEVHQLSNSKLEQERFKYFFRDPLTGLFNKDYLNMIFEKEHIYGALYIVSLKNFSQYNNKFGWDKGDLQLQKISNILNENFFLPNGLAFRIYGDDFVVLNEKSINISEILKPIIEEFQLLNIIVEYKFVNIKENKITNFDELHDVF